MQKPPSPETPPAAVVQLEAWNDAVELLGGKRATARLLGVAERTVRALCSGERSLHTGWLRDISEQLLAHADRCRKVERLLSPSFTANLTPAQQSERPDRRRIDAKER